MTADRIILNIPHASPSFLFGKEKWGKGIEEHVQRWTDWYTDELFAGCARDMAGKVAPVIYPYSRFFCDVERLEDDPLEAIGQGIVYTEFEGVKRSLDEGEKERILRSYAAYMGMLKGEIKSYRDLLIDCHSFPADLSEVEVCIGFNEDWSKPDDELIRMVVKHFVDAGFRVGVNNPYSNSISPATGFVYKSIMIELNKATYMDGNEANEEKMARMQGIIRELYKKILGL